MARTFPNFCLIAATPFTETFRRTSSPNFWRIASLGIREHANLRLVEPDLTDSGASIRLLERTHAGEVYKFAAQSFVGLSFDQPVTTAEITGVGALHLLEAIRQVNPKIRVYQASTSEMFGKVQAVPQDENTPFCPRSLYGVAKLFAHWTTISCGESYGIFGVSVILFNHESPLRSLEFVARKITDGIARIKLGKRDFLELGNLDARRDWGFAREYVDGMWRMLPAPEPGVYVLASGKNASVRDSVFLAARAADIEIKWQGTGEHERGIDTKSGKTIIRVNPKFYRPAAKRDLRWEAKTPSKRFAASWLTKTLSASRTRMASSN
jgi:GDPmannose 4,6-dehydratase